MRMRVKSSKQAALEVALAADAEFSRELVRVYGASRSGDMRYATTHNDPELVQAALAKLAADERWRDTD